MYNFVEKKSSGRPKSAYNTLCERQKRYRICDLKENYDSEAIRDANVSFTKEGGERKKVKLLKIINNQPSTPVINKFKKSDYTPMSPEKAIALLINNNMSRQNDQNHRNSALEQGCNLYPEYNQVIRKVLN